MAVRRFITNGVYGDLYFVAAKSGEGGGRSREVTMFILEKGTEGFSVARPLEKWVMSSDTAELVFDNCFVPNEHVLGDVHRGFYAIMQNFQNERLVLGAQSMGEAQCYRKSHSTTKNRKASTAHSGINKPFANVCRSGSRKSKLGKT